VNCTAGIREMQRIVKHRVIFVKYVACYCELQAKVFKRCMGEMNNANLLHAVCMCEIQSVYFLDGRHVLMKYTCTMWFLKCAASI